jgi:hypothetical protein
LFFGKSTPAILAKAAPPLSLPLFVAFVLADDSDYTFSANNFTLAANFFDG